MEEKIRAWIYVRVGSDVCEGDPIGQQASLLTEYAERHDIEVVGWSFDKRPGINLGRDGLGKAVRAIESRRANAVLVLKADRIFRDTKELASFYLKLKAMGAKLISATEEGLESAMEILAEGTGTA